MRTIAFWLKQTAALKQKHTYGKQEESDAPPIGLEIFHGKLFLCVTRANVAERF